jgi:DNA mismatch endonuclease (patch repair protein)
MDFWNAKLDANKARDARAVRALKAEGWRVVTCWECQLRKDPVGQAKRVVRHLDEVS